ncbi:PD40 domain-containing protein [bacterium]|nr:PD40 domain-containing protein [bacterium]
MIIKLKLPEFLLITCFLLVSCNQLKKLQSDVQNENGSKFSELSGPYLGQKPPGMIPELFAPGLLSAGGDVASITFNPNGMELCYFLWTPGGETLAAPKGPFQQMIILYTRLENGHWREPREFSFNPNRAECYPSFSPDGERIYYISWKNGRGSTMFVDKSNGVWCEPKMIDLQDDNQTGFVSVANNGNLYFSNFIKYRYENGGYSPAEKLKIPVT